MQLYDDYLLSPKLEPGGLVHWYILCKLFITATDPIWASNNTIFTTTPNFMLEDAILLSYNCFSFVFCFVMSRVNKTGDANFALILEK